jgi:hypothetical protein
MQVRAPSPGWREVPTLVPETPATVRAPSANQLAPAQAEAVIRPILIG